MNIEELIAKIIPPANLQIRSGYNNIPYLIDLNEDEKNKVEDVLIGKLSIQEGARIDSMIVETLAYLKSKKALPTLRGKLKGCSDDQIRLDLAVAIFEISQDNSMVSIAVESLKKMDNKSDPYYVARLTTAFYILIKFKDPEINKMIKSYTKHKEMLVRYNAKQALGIA